MTNPLRLLFWELTARCNLKCCHCRADAQAHPADGELTTREALAVVAAIREAGDPILILTGGEPLVRADFFDLADACVRCFSRVALATNGTLIDDEIAGEIVGLGVQRVSVSLDGATAATHDAFRGVPGSFERALRGYDALARAGASLQVNVTLTKWNRGEIEDLLKLAIARHAEAFHVFALVPVGCGATLADDVRLAPAEMEAFLGWLARQAAACRDRLHIKATCAPQYYRIAREAGTHPAGTAPAARPGGMQAMTRGCLAGSAVCFLSRAGDVQPCGYLPLNAGNVREQRFGDIWRGSEVLGALRDPARLGGEWAACDYRTLCGGCRARAFAATSDALAEDPDCAYRAPTPEADAEPGVPVLSR